MMRHINRLIIHCAASPNGKALTRGGMTAAQAIDGWHRERNFRRSDAARAAWNPGLESIGYHWIIDVDGTVYSGRHHDEIGAHAAGYNADSLGVCLVGTDRFTTAQWVALRGIVERTRQDWPIVRVIGHRDLPDVHKTCPGFDVTAWDCGSREPVHGHIYQAAP